MKSMLYEQVARIGKSVYSPKRQELLELLAQGEKSVETLVAETGIDMRLTSGHLKALREARHVNTRRDGIPPRCQCRPFKSHRPPEIIPSALHFQSNPIAYPYFLVINTSISCVHEQPACVRQFVSHFVFSRQEPMS